MKTEPTRYQKEYSRVQLAIFDPQVRFVIVFVYVNKVVLNTAMLCFHIIYSCFPAIRTGLSSCDRDHMVHKAKNSSSLALH